MAKYKNKIIIALVIAAVLAFAFQSGGNAPEHSGLVTVDVPKTEAIVPDENTDENISETQEQAAPAKESVSTESENDTVTDPELTCTLSVRCDTILSNLAWLDAEKLGIVPDDGVIYAPKTVTFCEGESVFDLLLREMKESKIHLEFEDTPIYNSAYIEGIANLYEFDCGELSGWMYKVNGIFPNYGCSRYQLKAGDRVE
ncbi:MAG: DUF4430 domain-containing protein, partial [Clostridia bacterium]|nr:DUF4430 domain-containing protein [Clostridia bacterium]